MMLLTAAREAAQSLKSARRRWWLLSGVVFLLFVLCAGWYAYVRTVSQPVKSASTKKNVVIISIDSVRADHMSLYGYERNTTPHIDAFAKDAVVFNNYFATAFLTPVSETSVQTGLYPASSKVINFESSLSGTARTLAELLKENGYSTAAMGTSPEFKPGHEVLYANFVRGFDVYQTRDGGDFRWFGRSGLPIKKAISWMQQTQAEGKPYYFWLHVGSAHWPYGQAEPNHFGSEAYTGFFAPKRKQSGRESQVHFDDMYGHLHNGILYKIGGQVLSTDTTADVAYVNDRYDDGLVMTDREVGEILAYLSQPEVRDSTIVIIQSEHGEDLGDHGYIAHYDVLDTQIHTPLVMRVPGIAAQRTAALVSGVDIVPTVMDLLNLRPANVDGVSLAPLITGASQVPPRTEVYIMRTPLWERVIRSTNPWLEPFVEQDNVHHYYDTAIRTDTWKLIHRLSRDVMKEYSWYGRLTGTTIDQPEYELYNVSADPQELHNVYAANKNDAAVIDLQQKLNTWEADVRDEVSSVRPVGPVQPYF